MTMTWTEMSQMSCEHHSFRVTSQTPMPNSHGHEAKSACVKLKLGSIACFMLAKKCKKSKSISVILTESS